jgi:hypothetical protein
MTESGFTRFKTESQVPQDRVPSSRLLLGHYRSCPNRPSSKVRFLFVDGIALAYPYHTRAYAVAGKNKWVAGILYSILALQLGITICVLVWATGPGWCFHPITRTRSITKGNIPARPFPQIPLDAYRACLPRTSKTLTLIQVSVSLTFGKHSITVPHFTISRINRRSIVSDVAVFLLVIIQRHLIRSRYPGMGGPDILSKLGRDAEIYFGCIATSHLLVLVFLAGVSRFLASKFEFYVC